MRDVNKVLEKLKTEYMMTAEYIWKKNTEGGITVQREEAAGTLRTRAGDVGLMQSRSTKSQTQPRLHHCQLTFLETREISQ